MFGYIKPRQSELLVRELELYKSVYCGLCRALKKYVSFFMPATLSYDGTMLAIFRMALEKMPPKIQKKRCIASPFKKKCSVCSCNGDSLCYTAKACCAMLYYKLKDDIADSDTGFFRRFLSRILVIFMLPSLKKIRKDKVIDELCDNVEKAISNLSMLEKSNSSHLDSLAYASGEILAYAACCGLSGQKREIAYNFGLSVGKWLYIIDAFDDMEKDFKSGAFNPIILHFSSIENARSNNCTVDAVLSHYVSDAMAELEKIDFTCYNNILKNTLCLGLDDISQKVLDIKKSVNNPQSV